MKTYDSIIIGSGIAGLNFALRAAEQGEKVIVITKKNIAEASTNFAQGGIAAVLSKLDDYKKHIKDTLASGSFHNNKRAVSYMVHHSPAAITRLIELGVPFATQHGKLILTREGGHSQRRIAFVSDYTGQAIEKALVLKIRRDPNITLNEHTFAVDLLVENRVCYGVQIIREQEFGNVYAKRIVLATGGIGQLYENTTNPKISTGDGLAMAARVGCSFRDMEFVQFHPTAFISGGVASAGNPRDPTFATPPRSRRALAARKNLFLLNGGVAFLISEAVRGEGAYLRNAQGQRFMSRYHKLSELAPRDIVSRAVFGQAGSVFLDIRHKDPEFIKTRFPTIYQTLKSYGVDMTKELVPISPAAHYMCGGIKVNLRGETGIKNLYAFGEVAGTGVHGANRLASNSLLEALVFSDRILAATHERHRTAVAHFPIPRYRSLSHREKKIVETLRKKLQHAMWEYVGIVRSKKSLLAAQQELIELEKLAHTIYGNSTEILELRNMIQAAELITKAALARKKSLGCHYRVD